MVSMTCPSVNASPCQRKWDSRSLGRLGDPGPDDEPQPGLIELAQVRRGQHPCVGDHDHVGDAVAVLELLDDRHNRGGLGLVAFEAADLEREPAPIHQQTHDDLWIDAAFLGVADLAQVVFVLCLEVQRGDVVEHQLTRPRGRAWSRQLRPGRGTCPQRRSGSAS